MQRRYLFCFVFIFALMTFVIVQAQNQNNSKDKNIYPPLGDEFYLMQVPIDQVQSDQVFFHVSNEVMTEDAVLQYFEDQRKGIQDNYNGGDIYAYGYVKPGNPATFVFAPVNGGKIEPGKSRHTDRAYFYDKDDRLLAILTVPNGGGWSFQTQSHGGHGSNVPAIGEGYRNFHYVFSLNSPATAPVKHSY